MQKLKPQALNKNDIDIEKKWYLGLGYLKIGQLRQRAAKAEDYD